MPHRPKAACYQFQNSGFCSYGTSCRFSHDGDLKKQVHHRYGRRGNSKPHSPQHGRQKAEQDVDAISKFFSRYPSFAYDEERGVAEEFYRMCDFFAWDRDDEERDEARQAFKDALVIRFNSLYGTNVADLENWHKLCIAVCIEPLPATISECKARIKDIHVNLVDLVDTSGQNIELFTCLDELREYTIETGKFFPKESAYAGGVLKFLLREIL
ncbi:hypothetical protein P171DRAFT_82746 [Karstenula rhodostoma CBS 690.94]|uniref:C3H1-type domain-containing protein n=1 Tax=Karstenula rhodostoma CBS 690.94 TaxID=1392251 RepID=A0A9P4U9F2_9PLEO|nr:hypothetical protein P171DRAFT_82746 [Karstenula rhodostoma CBS 690.94]